MQKFLKENGIQAKFTAPFHPSTNGQAERYVQTVKNKLKAMMNEEGSIQDKLQRFLMMYRKTPNNATGLSPGEMMYKRIYRTRIDLVKRNHEIRTYINNEEGVNKEFQRGDKVQIRMYNSDKWKFGKIIDRKGKLHYEIEVDGRIHLRHVDQITRSKCLHENVKIPDTYHIRHRPFQENNCTPKLPENNFMSTQMSPTITSPKVDQPRECLPRISSGTPEPVTQHLPTTPGVELRRSIRIKRPPTRLDL